jgi:acylglycerol lipase
MSIAKMFLLGANVIIFSICALSLNADAAQNKNGRNKETVVVKGLRKSSLPIWSAKIKVPYRSWIPVEKPKVVLLCVHGLGFSSESYAQFGRRMAGQGFAVYAVDVRGFGDWLKRESGNQVDFENCLSDIESALNTLHKVYAKTPVFLVGESMGGAIALRATSRNPQLVNGLISSVPSSDRYAKLSSEVIVGAHYLTHKDKEMSIEPEVMDRATSNPNLKAKWAAEPTNRLKMTPKELKQFDDFMKGNEDAAALVENVPVLMLAGFKDKLVKPEGTISLFNDLSTQDKLLMIIGDGEHLLLEENQLSDQLAQLLVDWVKNEAYSKTSGINAHP